MTNEERLTKRSKIKFLRFWQLLFLPFQIVFIIVAFVAISPVLLLVKTIEFIDDADIKDTYWAEELSQGRIHRYNEEEVRTLLGVEIQ